MFNVLLLVVLCLTCPSLFSVFFSVSRHELYPLKTVCSLLMPLFLSCFITKLFESLWRGCFPSTFGTTFTYVLLFHMSVGEQ